MNKTIIVTGASRGIGKEIAIDLAKDGHNVILNYNKSEKDAKEIQYELKKREILIDIFKADVSKRSEAKNLVEYAIHKYKKIDVLINNAGKSQTKLFSEITDDDWTEILNNNLYSVFYMLQESLKYMMQRKSGTIINISSIWGITGASCETHYSVSKAGIDALTKSLAKELGPSNIRINSIAPGIINTEMNKNLSKNEISNLEKDIPLERMGKPIDIYRCVKWLIEDEYTTGQVISVNGGWLI